MIDTNNYWTFIGNVTEVRETTITVSLIEPETRDTVYKVIPKENINFDVKEDDCIKIEFTTDINNNLVGDYKISYYEIIIDEKEKQRIIQEIKDRKDRNDII